MFLIRPAALKDLDELVALAESAGTGLTTLPRDPEFLRGRIESSQSSFRRIHEKRPSGDPYIFVLEDLATRRVIGTSRITPKTGGYEPFYAYRVADGLLHLVAEHNGPCEIGGLFLHADYRGSDAGRFLSLVRFLFAAENLRNFDPTVVAEIRGVIDESGRSPFWEAVGRHFFDSDFSQADYVTLLDKKIISERMPQHPIYIRLLPKEAQDVVGKPHPHSAPAMKILEHEGMAFTGMVDIFDAGPVVVGELARIRTVRESFRGRVAEIGGCSSVMYMIGTEFRAALGTLERHDGEVRIAREVAETLGLAIGDWIRAAALR